MNYDKRSVQIPLKHVIYITYIYIHIIYIHITKTKTNFFYPKLYFGLLHTYIYIYTLYIHLYIYGPFILRKGYFSDPVYVHL